MGSTGNVEKGHPQKVVDSAGHVSGDDASLCGFNDPTWSWSDLDCSHVYGADRRSVWSSVWVFRHGRKRRGS